MPSENDPPNPEDFSLAHSPDIMNRLSQPSEWTQEDEKAVLEPYNYIAANPGKDIRGKMIAAFNIWLKVPPHTLATISEVVTMLHQASLVIDDIEDDSHLRRGNPVAHKIYGIPQSLNSANYAYFLAYQELFDLQDRVQAEPGKGKIDLLRIVNEEALNLHRGQGLEILWRDTLQCPTEDQYIGMVNNKTGGLFRLGVKLMMACATENVGVDFVPLINTFGIMFQIRDDYANLKMSEYEDNKGFAEDLNEGKFSFPIVHAIRTAPSNRHIISILQKRSKSDELKKQAIAYMQNQTKSFEYTASVCSILEGKLREEVARLGGNPMLERIIDALKV